MSFTEEGISQDILESESANIKAEATDAAAAAAAAATAAAAASPASAAPSSVVGASMPLDSSDLEICTVESSPREATFVLRNEDHTLGNALRGALMRNSKVAYAGYSVPHPLTREIHLRIVVAPQAAQRDCITPEDCLAEGLRDLRNSARHLLQTFDAAFKEFFPTAKVKVESDEDVKPII